MLTVEVISIEKLIRRTEGVEVLLPGIDGQLGIRTGHIPLITPLKAGEVIVKKENGTEEVFAVFGGFVEIIENNIHLMVDSAELAEELDEQAVQEAIERANEQRTTAQDERQLDEALIMLNANIARLKAIRRHTRNR